MATGSQRKWRSADAVPFVPSPGVELAAAAGRGDLAEVRRILSADLTQEDLADQSNQPPVHCAIKYAKGLRKAIAVGDAHCFTEIAAAWHATKIAPKHTYSALEALYNELPDLMTQAAASRNVALLELAVHQVVLQKRIGTGDHVAIVGALAAMDAAHPPDVLFRLISWTMRSRDGRAACPAHTALGPAPAATDAAGACLVALRTGWLAAAQWLVYLFGGDSRFATLVCEGAPTDAFALPALAPARRILGLSEPSRNSEIFAAPELASAPALASAPDISGVPGHSSSELSGASVAPAVALPLLDLNEYPPLERHTTPARQK